MVEIYLSDFFSEKDTKLKAQGCALLAIKILLISPMIVCAVNSFMRLNYFTSILSIFNSNVSFFLFPTKKAISSKLVPS